VETPSLDEQRRLAVKRMYCLKKMNILPFDELIAEPRLVSVSYLCKHAYDKLIIFIDLSLIIFSRKASHPSPILCFFQAMVLFASLFQYEPSTAIKFSLTFDFFSNAVRGSGTSKHYEYIEAIEEGTVRT
jgi:hypothetical protein